jgi:hypothetical protein
MSDDAAAVALKLGRLRDAGGIAARFPEDGVGPVMASTPEVMAAAAAAAAPDAAAAGGPPEDDEEKGDDPYNQLLAEYNRGRAAN